MPAKKRAAPKHTYQIMVERHLVYRYDVEDVSAEKACRLLQRRLLTEDATEIEAEGKLLIDHWGDPREPGEEWAIMRTSASEVGNFLLLQTWNGKNFVVLGEGEVGDDISQVMRKLFDPRAKRAKPKRKM
jgi:hypothetical protein